MTVLDREPFETPELVDTYLKAVPLVEPGYRSGLESTLRSAEQGSRAPLWRMRRLQLSIGGLAAALVAGVLFLFGFPIGPASPTLTPQSVLARALQAIYTPIPYSGTSSLTFNQDKSSYQETSTWSVHDATHWRVVLRTLRPLRERRTQVVVANGRSAVWTGGANARVVHLAIKSPAMGAGLLNIFQAQEVAVGHNLKQFLAWLRSGTSGVHGRVIGEGRLLNRQVDVIELWPVVGVGSGACSSSPCTKNERGYGRARIWIDHASGIVLQTRQWGVPQSVTHAPRDMVYRVTSISLSP